VIVAKNGSSAATPHLSRLLRMRHEIGHSGRQGDGVVGWNHDSGVQFPYQVRLTREIRDHSRHTGCEGLEELQRTQTGGREVAPRVLRHQAAERACDDPRYLGVLDAAKPADQRILAGCPPDHRAFLAITGDHETNPLGPSGMRGRRNHRIDALPASEAAEEHNIRSSKIKSA